MTIKERKDLIIRLGKQFLKETDQASLKMLREAMIDHILSARYDDDKIDSVRSGIREWGDMSSYIDAVGKKHVDERLMLSTNLSLVGLSTLLDFSSG